jgi:hypothetical protein
LATQKIETDDAVGVDVRMHGDGAVRRFHEGDFGGFYETLVSRGNEYDRTLEGGRTYRIIVGEFKVESIGFSLVDRIVIENADVHLPFSQILRGGYLNARREVFVKLRRLISRSPRRARATLSRLTLVSS